MEIPKWLEKSIIKCAYHEALASRENYKIREWLSNNGLNNDTVIDQLIDCVELSNVPEEFIKFIKDLDNKDSENGRHYI